VRSTDRALDGRVESGIIRALTDAIVSIYGERARALAVVELIGIPENRCGIAGFPPMEPVVARGQTTVIIIGIPTGRAAGRVCSSWSPTDSMLSAPAAGSCDRPSGPRRRRRRQAIRLLVSMCSMELRWPVS
jgi:hypothetical protein